MVSEIGAKFVNWDRLYVSFDEVKKNNDRFTDSILNTIGKELVKLIRKKAPKDTGAYAKSWKVQTTTPNSVIVSSNADPMLFVILEFTGARPHRIEGNPILKFEVGGQTIFRAFVNHPGQKAKPHVRPSMKELEMMILEVVYSQMDVHFPMLMNGRGKMAASRN